MDDQDIQAEGPEALAARLGQALTAQREAAERDPFANPVLQFAARLSRMVDQREIGMDELEALAAELAAQSFEGRAKRLRSYLGGADLDADRATVADLCGTLAAGGDFEAFQKAVGSARFGVVFTAHPTFSLRQELAEALVELATGRDAVGEPLSDAGVQARRDLARRLPHEPPSPLTLDIEHDWSVRALQNAHDALESAYHAAFAVARARWPEEWRALKPRLVSLASWVGYDTDGRTDITWLDTTGKRLTVKRLALERHRAAVSALLGGAAEESAWRATLQDLSFALDRAWETVRDQLKLLQDAQADPARTAAFSRAMVQGREASLADTAPLIALIDAAVAAAPDDAQAERLLVVKAVIGYHGLSLAHVHVRLNASQLHNAIRRQIGLDTPPNDPANRRSYFGTVGELIGRVRPVSINFQSVMAEQSSAKRLMMTVAQMLKFIDGGAPVRFLIAETESGFTLLTALYYARLFGVDEHVDISPLFETEEALARGEAVIEEALRSPDFVAYLKKRGRLAVQLGYSDSGRFVGQMAATFRIERLKLRLAELMAAHGLEGLEVVLFDTHGESIGRGGHPLSLADRLRYLAPPRSHAEFAERGVRTKQEVSWQGGDGYLAFFTGPAAQASLARILEFSFGDDSEGAADPIYSAPDFASEFFATVQQEFTALAADPDYAALLGLYGLNLLEKMGSRPDVRQSEDKARKAVITSVAQLRAIPNNAILQQMGYLADVAHGVGRAAAKDEDTFELMLRRSPRFRRAMQMARRALRFSDVDVLRAYLAAVDPAMWLARAGRARSRLRSTALRQLAELSEDIAQHDRLDRVARTLQRDRQFLAGVLEPEEAEDGSRLILLHALRAAVIQRICLLAARMPEFAPQHGVTRRELQERLMRLEVPAVVERLSDIFPRSTDERPADGDFGERASYQPERALTYAYEEDTLFRPLLRLYELFLRLGAAVTHEIGACG